jgi:enoyl-CoA hydratase/carnithine racemase
VVPREELLDTALEVARTLSQRSPFAMGVIKELASETRDLPLSEGLRREAQGFIRCIGSADGAEGVVAFLEKRQPEFTGR